MLLVIHNSRHLEDCCFYLFRVWQKKKKVSRTWIVLLQCIVNQQFTLRWSQNSSINTLGACPLCQTLNNFIYIPVVTRHAASLGSSAKSEIVKLALAKAKTKTPLEVRNDKWASKTAQDKVLAMQTCPCIWQAWVHSLKLPMEGANKHSTAIPWSPHMYNVTHMPKHNTQITQSNK